MKKGIKLNCENLPGDIYVAYTQFQEYSIEKTNNPENGYFVKIGDSWLTNKIYKTLNESMDVAEQDYRERVTRLIDELGIPQSYLN